MIGNEKELDCELICKFGYRGDYVYGEPRTREERSENRRRLKETYRNLFDLTEGLLYRHDPIGINFGDNPDEYVCEVETILPRLSSCTSEEDVLRVTHEEFVKWFDADTAGPREHYREIAGEIWRLWVAHQSHKD